MYQAQESVCGGLDCAAVDLHVFERCVVLAIPFSHVSLVVQLFALAAACLGTQVLAVVRGVEGCAALDALSKIYHSKYFPMSRQICRVMPSRINILSKVRVSSIKELNGISSEDFMP